MDLRTKSSSSAYLAFFLLFFAALLLSHANVLDLPYFWDELGQFVPASLDIYEQGAWVPKSTLPNVHPPGVMAYLAGVWSLTGYSVVVTRVAMLALAALGVLCVFALAIELCRPVPGMPAFGAVLLLLVSPLFWAQSLMVQLDMPAMVFTALALLLFLRGRYGWCVAASTVLVLMKESSLIVPAIFGALLLWERRWRDAFLFFIPAVAVAAWLYVLYRTTGHPLGNQEFTHYNIAFQLHPVRLPLTIVRRFFYVFIDNFHWIGSIGLFFALRRTSVFRTRAWAIVAVVAVAQMIVVSVLGGAALERYLMPVLPLFYIAVAAAFTVLARRWAIAVMAAGLGAFIFISSPFPYPFENNASFVSFVRLQQQAAQFIEAEYPNGVVASAWPFPDAVKRPEFGFVTRKLESRGLDNFNTETVLALKEQADVLVVYSRTWEPTWGVIGRGWVRQFLGKYYFYAPQITEQQIVQGLGLQRVARWERGGQWIEVYARRAPASTMVL